MAQEHLGAGPMGVVKSKVIEKSIVEQHGGYVAEFVLSMVQPDCGRPLMRFVAQLLESHPNQEFIENELIDGDGQRTFVTYSHKRNRNIDVLFEEKSERVDQSAFYAGHRFCINRRWQIVGTEARFSVSAWWEYPQMGEFRKFIQGSLDLAEAERTAQETVSSLIREVEDEVDDTLVFFPKSRKRVAWSVESRQQLLDRMADEIGSLLGRIVKVHPSWYEAKKAGILDLSERPRDLPSTGSIESASRPDQDQELIVLAGIELGKTLDKYNQLFSTCRGDYLGHPQTARDARILESDLTKIVALVRGVSREFRDRNRSSCNKIDSVASFLLSDLCLGGSRHADAEAHARAAVTADPGSADNHMLLGRCLMRLNRRKEAEQAFVRGCAIDPSNGRFADELRTLRSLNEMLDREGQ